MMNIIYVIFIILDTAYTTEIIINIIYYIGFSTFVFYIAVISYTYYRTL